MARIKELLRKHPVLAIVVVLMVIALVPSCAFIADAGHKAARLTTRWICPCIYTEGREMEHCVEAMVVDTSLFVSIDKDDSEQSVTATAFGFIESKAVRVPGQSCLLLY